MITLYCDGSCRGNHDVTSDRPGGWAYMAIGDKSECNSGSTINASNNTMELMAIREGLKVCPPGVEVLVKSDSQFAIGCIGHLWGQKPWKVRQTNIVSLVAEITRHAMQNQLCVKAEYANDADPGIAVVHNLATAATF